MDPHAVDQNARALLAAAGIDEPVVAIEPLSGGVSSDVFKVTLGGRTLCVKFAIERLRVAREWHAPVHRSEAEYNWLATIDGWFPDVVPHVFGFDRALHGIAMAYLPPDDYANWKADVLRGRVDAAVAPMVGERLAVIHARSAADPGLAVTFANQGDFEALRLDPYLRSTAAQHPKFSDRLHGLANALADARIALVHGDVSPKNILCGPAGPVFIDAECATWSDPAFDVAFVLNHLAIKALVLPHGEAVRQQAQALWNSYRCGVDWEPVATIEARVAALLPALMLARVDGKSPLEYLNDETAPLVRERALDLLDRPSETIDALLSAIKVSGR